MTLAVVLAAGAGACVGAVVAELLAARAEKAGAAAGVSAGARRPRTSRGSRRASPIDTLAAALARVGRHLGVPAAPADLESRLAAAGAPLGLTVADLMAVKCGAALVGAIAMVPLAASLPGRLGVAALLTTPAAGFLGPDVVLARRARARRAAMGREVADVLDLVRVAVQAGHSPGRALAEVGRRRGGPLAAELRRAAGEIELGADRAEALDRLVARCPVESVPALAAAVLRTERHGAPLAPALEALALAARAEQARATRDAAARAAPQIQLVVALVLVPAVMLLVAAALVQSLTG